MTGKRENRWFLVVVASAVFSLCGVLAGAHIYRWEAIVWLTLVILGNFGAWLYSRWWSRD